MGWLASASRWFSRREANRDIFRFWDGHKVRGVDPLRAYRAMLAHPEFDWELHPTLIDQMDSDNAGQRNIAIAASEVTIRAIRDVFGIRAWSNKSRGLTEAETIALLVSFVEFLVGVKKNGNPTPISPEHMVPQPSPTSSTGEFPTSASLDSGSTPTEPPSETLVESSSPSTESSLTGN